MERQGNVHVIWPWQDRDQGFSLVKASAFVLMFVPAIWLIDQVITKQFGPVPLGGMTYWSGLWALALLMLALAVTPVLKIFGWRRLIIVRRMISRRSHGCSRRRMLFSQGRRCRRRT
jgi:hypothetical protein